MNPTQLAYIAGIVFAVLLTLWGLFSNRRSYFVGVVAAVVALVAGLAAWHAFAYTHSIPWTVGYGLAAAFALLSALRQFNPTG